MFAAGTISKTMEPVRFQTGSSAEPAAQLTNRCRAWNEHTTVKLSSIEATSTEQACPIERLVVMFSGAPMPKTRNRPGSNVQSTVQLANCSRTRNKHTRGRSNRLVPTPRRQCCHVLLLFRMFGPVTSWKPGIGRGTPSFLTGTGRIGHQREPRPPRHLF